MATIENEEVPEALRRFAARHQQLCQAAKITSAGCMIGTSLLFPIAYVDGLPFRALTLAIFILSLITFHALHLEPFIRFGPYTAPIALLILLIYVLLGGASSKSDILPWLPLYTVVACLVTAALNGLSISLTPYQHPFVTQVHGGSNIEYPSPNYPRSGPSSVSSGPRVPSQSYRNDSDHFHHMGPGSSRSVQTGSGATEFTLGDLQGARRDPQAAFIYGNANYDHGRHEPEDYPSATTREAPAFEAANDLELGQVRPSQDSAMESRAPLLGSYD